MKKVLKWTIYIVLMILGGLAGRVLVVYSMTGHLALSPRQAVNTNLTYTDVNLGWIKTSLPFSLQEDKQQALHIKETINTTQHAQAVQDIKMYTGTYNPQTFAFMLETIAYAPTITPDLLNGIAGIIAGAGFETDAKRAMQQAQSQKENGSIKYLYQTRTKFKNTPAVFGTVLCAKGNTVAILFGNGNDTPQNRDIINHILSNTVCFPQEK